MDTPPSSSPSPSSSSSSSYSSSFIKRAHSHTQIDENLFSSPILTEDQALNKKYRKNHTIQQTKGKTGEVSFVHIRSPFFKENLLFSSSSSSSPTKTVHQIIKSENETPKSRENVFAVKKQWIQSPKHLNDKSYRELRILAYLWTLRHQSKCINFVELIDWFKSRSDYITPEKEPTKTSGYHRKSKQTLHLVLEYIDSSRLADKKKLPIDQYRVILFQTLYALFISQQELEFVHNDLHSKNILLQTFPPGKSYMIIKDEDFTWVVDRYIIKFVDFGLSRIKGFNQEVIFNKRDPVSSIFSPTQDVECITRGFRSIKVLDADSAEEYLLRDLRRKMNKGVPLKILLRHKFFAPLSAIPEDCTQENTIYISSKGLESANKTPIPDFIQSLLETNKIPFHSTPFTTPPKPIRFPSKVLSEITTPPPTIFKPSIKIESEKIKKEKDEEKESIDVEELLSPLSALTIEPKTEDVKTPISNNKTTTTTTKRTDKENRPPSTITREPRAQRESKAKAMSSMKRLY